MIFITGPLYSGKRTFARTLPGRCIADAQQLAAGCKDNAELEKLADKLSAYDIVLSTEVGGGVVPVDPAERAARGKRRAACLYAGGTRCVCGADVLRHPHRFERRIAGMLIYLLRHGLTEYNAEKRYQGQRDIPLSAAGRAVLCRADIFPKTVYITPLCRTRQTAEVLFPGAKLIEIDGLKEMCFGSFEGRNYIEMEHDPDYLAWVAANCESPCPDGETKAAFCERICAAFSALVDKALADGEEMLVILAHGGTQMAAMERYALPHKDYYEWCAPNAGGFVLDAKDWASKRVLYLVKSVQYTKEAQA